MYDKTKYIYVGLDHHKEQHTAVIMDCFNEKLGEITFQNKPSEFGKLITKCKKYCTDGKGIVFALENSYGYGRALAAWLIERNYIVKDANPALSYAYRKSVPQYKKNDAMPEDMYWTLSQLVNLRANLKTHYIRLKNQLHEQVCGRTQPAVYLRGWWRDDIPVPEPGRAAPSGTGIPRKAPRRGWMTAKGCGPGMRMIRQAGYVPS